ncbi:MULTISPECIES: hypothetical protein [unclassified Thioalkalivibrio]|uniref:hypothetical protein n=1 Tax=unclassified Thioalkalivibrio TaxID=2621013 RepID=UPI000367B4E9|nr:MULTISPECIES: hypothetical protein [unclassified Thioalkalivibrio]
MWFIVREPSEICLMQGNHAKPTLTRPRGLLAVAAAAVLVMTTALTPLTVNEAQAEILRGTSGDFEVQTREGLPARGQSQSGVRSRHGEPSQRHPTVGDPPITRWDYSDFSVVFEGEYVLHSIVHGEQTPRRP